MTNLSGPFIAPKSGKAKQLVMFLHGYGSNGDDLLSIGQEWQRDLPDAAFVSPHAPAICESFSAGYQWFSLRAIDRATIERDKQAEAVLPVLNSYIDAQLAQWNVPENQLVVVGFSQGAMMAMYAMPRRKNACAGVIGYSGMLVDAAGLKNAPSKMPILAIHGDVDDVVPPQSLDEVEAGFTAAGFNVETILRPRLGHSIDPFGLIRGVEFIRECFDNASENTKNSLKV